MTKVMTNIELANKAKDVANNYKTLYIKGCFGSPMNATNKSRYTKNNEYNKRTNRVAKINKATADTFGFDCVCFIKGLLWGWNGNKNKTYGGASYGSNGVPDVGADGIMNYCTGVSKDFSKIEIGEIVHMSGHVGIYLGDGLVAECTPAWKDKVQITALGNLGEKKGYNKRTWTNHGKLKYIDYVQNSTNTSKPKETTKKRYTTGVYQVLSPRYIRTAPSMDGRIKKVKECTEAMKKALVSKVANADAQILAGHNITALQIITESNGRVWLKNYSGYVCIEGRDGDIFLKQIS